MDFSPLGWKKEETNEEEMGKVETDTQGNHCHFSMNMDFLGLALVVKKKKTEISIITHNNF